MLRHQLLEQIAGEFPKLVFQLQLNSRSQESCAFQEATDHRVNTLGREAAKTLGNARVLFGKLLGGLEQQAELTIVEVEKLLFHGYSGAMRILPLSSSRSATN